MISPGVRDVLKAYPTATSSKNWPEVRRLAASGDVDGAKELAARSEINPAVRSRNVVARRHAIERREFLARIVSAERALRAMMEFYAEKIADAVEDKGFDVHNIPRINELIHDQTRFLRSSLRIWLNAAVRDSAKMGFRHIGDALLPIFQVNREAFEQEIVAERALFEASLVFGIKRKFARRTTHIDVDFDTAKWAATTARIIKQITKNTIKGAGLRPSERIWELTARTELDLKRIVANGIGNAENPVLIARRIKKYVSPNKIDPRLLGVDPGPGVYRSPYRNAYRLAKTEMNHVYTKATVAFTKDKPWLQDGDIVLSPVHSDPDECDSLAAGGPYTPEQADEYLPAHPHCGCRYVPRIDPKYLGEDE